MTFRMNRLIRRRANATGTWQVTLPDTPLFVPEQLRPAIAAVEHAHLDLLLQTVSGFLSDESPRSTGHLAQGWQTEITGAPGGDVVGGRVFNQVPYAIVMERGRAPGYGISRDGIANLARWVRRTLGLAGREARSATYAIAWAIRQRGIKARHFVGPALSHADPKVRAIVNSLARAYVQATGGNTSVAPV
jgi:hypothetical protein